MSRQLTGALSVEGMEPSRPLEPELALWAAVLHLAIKDAKALVRRVARNPRLWTNPLFRSEVHHIKRFFRDQSMEPGGFGFICDLLGLNHEQALIRIDDQYLRHLKPVTNHPVPQADCPAC